MQLSPFDDVYEYCPIIFFVVLASLVDGMVQRHSRIRSLGVE